MPTNVSVPADAQRQRRARANYGQNAACKWVRKKAWRACDYTDDGHLRQFDTEEAFLAFEEERRVRGHSQAHYEKKPRDTVPEVQLALVEAITHAVAKDGNETRVQLQSMEEGIHERHDEHQATLCEIRTHQLQQDIEQSAMFEKKAALAEKQKAKNDAFASRVEAGDCTPLEEKQLRLKILTEEIRREEAEKKIEKQREKTRKQSEKRARADAANTAASNAPPKRRRKNKEVAPVHDGRCQPGSEQADPTTDDELNGKISGGFKEDFMSLEEAQALLEFCKKLLPEAARIHTGQFKNLSKQAPKLFCYDVDADGWAPQYKFADMAPVDYHLHHSGIRGTPLQGLVQRITQTYEANVNHIVINCYPFFSAYIPTHKDQPLSLESMSNKYETKDDVFIYSLGAERSLCFVRDTGAKQLWGRKLRSEMAILSEVKAQNNSMYVLSGDVNKACLHAQPMEHSEGKPTEMRFSITCRAACRLKVNTRLGKYQQFSGKRWETRDLPRAQSLAEGEETTSNIVERVDAPDDFRASGSSMSGARAPLMATSPAPSQLAEHLVDHRPEE